jgi:Tol biopolymer transport system component/ABC-type transport system involved in multi-copper enzyme maturation permease subunit
MFGTLFLKEWKEKFSIFVFGIGLLALSLAVYLGLPKDQNARELVMGGLLIIFFPFMALLLGAGGFEPESRSDAWAYLFSRPVSKSYIWGVKYLSLLSVLACLWLVFLGMMMTVPGLRALIAGFRFPIAFRIEITFLPWSVLVSLFFFTVAFSLSLFSGKWLNVLFAALFIGLALAFVASGEAIIVTSLLGDPYFDDEKWLHAFRWGLVLMAAAFAGASVLTLTRADFSQPRKKIARFAGYATPFLVAAIAVTAAWTALLPRTGDRYIYLIDHSGGATYFQTDRGIFKYSQANDKVSLLTRGQAELFGPTPIRAGKIVYQGTDLSIKKYKPTVLWAMNTDGSQRTRLVGGGFKPEDPRSRLSPHMSILSPDGKQVVFFDEGAFYESSRNAPPLWAINTDGSDLRNLPVPRDLVKGWRKDFWLNFVVWPATDPACFLLDQRANGPQGQSKLWLYNLRDKSCRALLNDVRLIWYGSVSPREDYLVFRYRTSAETKWRLDLLGLNTLNSNTPDLKEIEFGGALFASRLNWSPRGDKLAIFARQGTTPGTGAYVLMVFSITERKMLALREMTNDERTGQLYNLDWLDDDARVLLGDPTERCLKILRPDLSEEKRIPFPASIVSPYGSSVSGDKVLIVDSDKHRLWRLDLKTEGWKRVY